MEGERFVLSDPAGNVKAELSIHEREPFLKLHGTDYERKQTARPTAR